MKYLVIGSGGREHALAWRLLADGSADEVFVAPGNGGIEERFRVNIAIDDFAGIERFCRDSAIDIVVVGPEAPLVAGLVDFLTGKKIPAFGPTAAAARLEGSKLFAKFIMEKYGVPTAGHRDFSSKADLLAHIETIADYPIVIKLDGLAAGKGVGIPESKAEAIDFIERNVKDGAKVFVEDFLAGEEASVLGISDGETVLPFIAAQDHKRAYDGDRGPNTGGMGAYAPAPVARDAVLERVRREVLVPVVQGMKAEGCPFKGILYAGVIIDGDSIKVLEFNVRFGDPEAQVILPLLNGRLGDFLQASIAGSLHECELSFKRMSAITVVMASGGYPDDYRKGIPITGLDAVSEDLIVFHAGTRMENGACVTSGGRVLNVTALGESFQAARDTVYGEIGKIRFEGAHFRKDIGHRAMGR
ncbi:MAG TPA: phosphoribosylamine--glycine ligase [Spirochaetota bacterium]|nr:phosphoribosylamine--glycine ligase [Spirochaetota bacterium]